MQVGDLVKETTRMKRKCSVGVVLEVETKVGTDNHEEYLVHFFDDNDQCWMSKNFVETINANR